MQGKHRFAVLVCTIVFLPVIVRGDTFFKQNTTNLGPANIIQCASGMTCTLDGGMVSMQAGDDLWRDAGPCVAAGCNYSSYPVNHIWTPFIITNPNDGGTALFLRNRNSNATVTTKPYTNPAPTITLSTDSASAPYPTIEFRSANPPTTGTSWIWNSNSDFSPPISPGQPNYQNAPGPGVGLNLMSSQVTFTATGSASSGVRSRARFKESGLTMYSPTNITWEYGTGQTAGAMTGDWEFTDLADGGGWNRLDIDNLAAKTFSATSNASGSFGAAIIKNMNYAEFYWFDGGVVDAGTSRVELICVPTVGGELITFQPGSWCQVQIKRNGKLYALSDAGTAYEVDGGPVGPARQTPGIMVTCDVPQEYILDAGFTLSDGGFVHRSASCFEVTFHNYSTSNLVPLAAVYKAMITDDATTQQTQDCARTIDYSGIPTCHPSTAYPVGPAGIPQCSQSDNFAFDRTCP